MIGPLVAAQDEGVAFLVLPAGPAVSGREILLAQARFLLETTFSPAPLQAVTGFILQH